jgi:hypothetical protein
MTKDEVSAPGTIAPHGSYLRGARCDLWMPDLGRHLAAVERPGSRAAGSDGGAPARPACGDGGPPRAFAHLPGLSPRHCHDGRQGHPGADWYRGRAGGGLRRGARLDGVRHPQAEPASRCPRHRAHRGRPVGSVALPGERLEQRQSLRSARPGPLAALGPRLCRGIAGLPGAHGVGLRPDREPARGDAHARESHILHALRPRARGYRGAPHDLLPRIDPRAVGGRCSSRRGQQRKALAR